jgi:hypothetical protein
MLKLNSLGGLSHLRPGFGVWPPTIWALVLLTRYLLPRVLDSYPPAYYTVPLYNIIYIQGGGGDHGIKDQGLGL